jgi:hypothetical protein
LWRVTPPLVIDSYATVGGNERYKTAGLSVQQGVAQSISHIWTRSFPLLLKSQGAVPFYVLCVPLAPFLRHRASDDKPEPRNSSYIRALRDAQ